MYFFIKYNLQKLDYSNKNSSLMYTEKYISSQNKREIVTAALHHFVMIIQ